jgi:predicted FMN-binding regulatory protein PaiB
LIEESRSDAESRAPLTNPVPAHFQPRSNSDVLKLVGDHPLAWLVTPDLWAHLMPVRPRLDEAGELNGFRGHVPLSTADRLRRHATMLILFTGQTSYVSPSWFSDRRQAPTWASVSGSFRCRHHVGDDPAKLREIMEDLVQSTESGRPESWSLDELGSRYEGLAKGIAYFEADIIESRTPFRLCQNEDPGTFKSIVGALIDEEKTGLAEMMSSFRSET